MKKIFALLIFAFCTINIVAQDYDEGIHLFPDDLTIQPFTANMLEPKLGFLFQLGENELRLDIGNSVDVIRMVREDESEFSLGVDLFTYTLLRGESEFHFPVDAVDYLFGVNFGYKTKVGRYEEAGVRVRLSHISAHFVDGHYETPHNQWRGGRDPIVYSREFIEVMPYYRQRDLRLYAGFTYIYHVDPTHIGKDNYQLGFDYFIRGSLSETITPFIAYDIKVINIDAYTANNSISAGIKFGKPYGKGLSIYLNYYSGKSIHGEYYDWNKEYTALGFNVDL